MQSIINIHQCIKSDRLEECRPLTTRTGAKTTLRIRASPRGVDDPLMRMRISDDIGRTGMRAVTIGFASFDEQAPDREQRETFEASTLDSRGTQPGCVARSIETVGCRDDGRRLGMTREKRRPVEHGCRQWTELRGLFPSPVPGENVAQL